MSESMAGRRQQAACSDEPNGGGSAGAGGCWNCTELLVGVRNICSFRRDKLTPTRANGGCNEPFPARNEP